MDENFLKFHSRLNYGRQSAYAVKANNLLLITTQYYLPREQERSPNQYPLFLF
jgi:hypothetical protein